MTALIWDSLKSVYITKVRYLNLDICSFYNKIRDISSPKTTKASLSKESAQLGK